MHKATDSPQSTGNRPLLPNDASLAAGLGSILSRDNTGTASFTILKREKNPHSSTYPSEIVTCEVGGTEKLKVFCKYSRPPTSRCDHRHGITYESYVYERVLCEFEGSVPIYNGTFEDQASGTRCLAIEFLEDSLGVSRVPVSEGLVEAAKWLGRFHARFESQAEPMHSAHIRAYDEDYFQSWTTSSSVFSRPWQRRFPELQSIFANLGQLFGSLSSSGQTSIHGEFYPKNVLVRDGKILPIDWESTGFGAGEIDLAALTEGWPYEANVDCEKAYVTARWPTGAPIEFESRLSGARVYWHLTWLGDMRIWDRQNKTKWRFAELFCLAEKLGLTSRA